MANTVTDSRIVSVRGASCDFGFQYFEDDGTTEIDITGCTATLQVRSKSGAVFVTASLAIDVEEASFSVTLTPEQTRKIEEGMQTWGAEIVFPSGRIEPVGPGLEWRSLPEPVR